MQENEQKTKKGKRSSPQRNALTIARDKGLSLMIPDRVLLIDELSQSIARDIQEWQSIPQVAVILNGRMKMESPIG